VDCQHNTQTLRNIVTINAVAVNCVFWKSCLEKWHSLLYALCMLYGICWYWTFSTWYTENYFNFFINMKIIFHIFLCLSEVGYTSATTRRGSTKSIWMWWHWNIHTYIYIYICVCVCVCVCEVVWRLLLKFSGPLKVSSSAGRTEENSRKLHLFEIQTSCNEGGMVGNGIKTI
jgi:hypothetical protein